VRKQRCAARERIAPVSEPDLAKLSEASELCGIPTDILKLMAVDGLLPQVVRGKAGHVYFPRNDVPDLE
jgi:hypothetical protein